MEINKLNDNSDNWGYFVDLENELSNINKLEYTKNNLKYSKFQYSEVFYKEYCDEYKFNINYKKIGDIKNKFVNIIYNDNNDSNDNNENNDNDIYNMINDKDNKYFIKIYTSIFSFSMIFLILHYIKNNYNSNYH